MTMLSLIVVCATTFFVIYTTHWVYRWRNPKCNGGKLPPGSMGFPFIGETFELRQCSDSLDVHSFFKRRIQKYGSIFRTSLAGRQVVVSSDPNFIHFILQQEGKLVDLWYMDTFTKVLGQDDPSVLFIGSITKYFRSLIFNHFGIERMKSNLLPRLEALSKQNLCSWSARPSINVKEAVSSMVFNCASAMLFGYDPFESQEDLGVMFTNFLRSILNFPLNIPGTAFHESLKNQKMVLKMIKDVMKRRRCGSSSSSSSSSSSPEEKHRRRDALDDVMEDMKREAFLTDDFSAFVMFSLIIASSETISASLSLAVKLLTEHPSVLEELRDEHQAIIQMRREKDDHEESCITWEEYKSMTFTSYVINETLRLANLVPGLMRKARKDINYDGYIIPKGWSVLLVTSTLHLNSDKFPDPLLFNPWRWKDIGPEIMRMDFVVFGGGLRMCPGAEFGKAFIATFLHAMVTNYTWKKIKGGDVVRDPALTFKDDLYIQVSKK